METLKARQPKKRVSVICLGHVHRDHSLQVILLSQLKHLVKDGINVFYCTEQLENHTLAVKIERDKRCATQNAEYVTLPAIQKILRPPDKDHAKPYFTFKDVQEIRAFLKEISPSTEESEFRTLAEEISRFQMYIHQIPLNTFLDEHHIPLLGLECPNTEDLLNRSNNFSADLEAVEKNRVSHMAKTFHRKVLPTLEQNTLVITHGGALHTRRLAANILAEMQTQTDTNIELHVFALNSVSNYGRDSWAGTCTLIKTREESDSPSIKIIYETLPLRIAELIEKNQGESFESEEFYKVFQEATLPLRSPKLYFIPDRNADKRKLIEDLNGTIVQERDNGFYVKIRSVTLKAEQRKILGIERKMALLTDEMLHTLEENKKITLEKTCYPGKYLVTFPQDLFDFVKEIIEGKKVTSDKKLSTTAQVFIKRTK